MVTNLIDGNLGAKIGTTIKTLRQEKGQSQDQLSKLVSMSAAYISRLEAGEYESPSMTHVFKLAQGLGLTLRDFLEKAGLIPTVSSFESCLRGEGLNDEEIKLITSYKQFVYSNKNNKKLNAS